MCERRVFSVENGQEKLVAFSMGTIVKVEISIYRCAFLFRFVVFTAWFIKNYICVWFNGRISVVSIW